MSNDENESEKLQKEQLLQRMTSRASQQFFFLASAIQSYKQSEQLDEAGLLNFLEIGQAALSRLALCRRPDVDDKSRFAKDVKAIADKFGIAPLKLANLLRRAATYEALQKPTNSTGNPFLMAALDREPSEGEPEQTDD